MPRPPSMPARRASLPLLVFSAQAFSLSGISTRRILHSDETETSTHRANAQGQCARRTLTIRRASITILRSVAIDADRGWNMHVKGKVCVVTGAASGIGEAVARAYAEAGARGVVVADLKTSRDKLAKVAGDIDGLPITCDVGLEEDIQALIAAAEDKYGHVDVFFSNAGLSRKGQESASDADWDVSWRVHVMSHVFAARALVPGMLARGSGYLLNTASAAGLLASLNSMPYGVTKNAAVALAEHLAIQYGDRGIRVSVLCPQSVQTGMTTPGPSAARVDGVLQPPEVARMVIEAMEAERFLILSHPQVGEYMLRKASNRERWLAGMRRLRDKIYGAPQSA